MGLCSQCDEEKELTVHGTCWKCHLGSISFNTMIEARKNLKSLPSNPSKSAKGKETIELT